MAIFGNLSLHYRSLPDLTPFVLGYSAYYRDWRPVAAYGAWVWFRNYGMAPALNVLEANY